MTLTVDLTPELETRLQELAQREGVPVERLTVQILERHLPARDKGEALSALLRSWVESDPQEQRETGEYLVRALDEDRPSDRELFPAHLEGQTW